MTYNMGTSDRLAVVLSLLEVFVLHTNSIL